MFFLPVWVGDVEGLIRSDLGETVQKSLKMIKKFDKKDEEAGESSAGFILIVNTIGGPVIWSGFVFELGSVSLA